MTKILLSITGGGIRGVAAAQFLKRLEQATNKTTYDTFDMYAGTSIGSLIVGAIAYKQITGTQLADELFTPHNARIIMKKSLIDRILGQFQIRPMYSDEGKLEIIKKYIGNATFNQTQKNVIMTAYNIHTYKPKFFKSWIPIDNYTPVIDAANMSSAAPSYFPSSSIHTPNQSFWGIDGAICTNDPCDSAYADALKLYGEDEDIRIISIGTGISSEQHPTGIESKKWGAIQWVTTGDLLGMLMEGPQCATDYRMKQFTKALGHKYIRIDGIIENTSLDDVTDENISKLKEIGDQWWELYHQEVLNLLKI